MVVLLGVERDWERSVSVRPPHETLPFWRALLVPGDGSASQAPGVRGRLRTPVPPVHPFTPPSPRGATRGGAAFPPTSAAALAKQRTAEPPALASLESESSPPQPLRWWDAGGSKDAGTRRLQSRRRPAAGSAPGGEQPGRPGGRKPRALGGVAQGIPAAGGGKGAGPQEGSAGSELRPAGRPARWPRGEWQRRRARCQRRGAEPRALVGEGSGAGLAGRGRRRGRCRALELLAHGKESRAAGAELEEAAATAGSSLETASSGRERLADLSWVRGSSEPCAPEAAGVAWAQQRKEAGRWGRCSSHVVCHRQRQMGRVTRVSERIGPRRGSQPGVGVLTSR
ncbi:hypothetical protein R6Z07F_014608 [Ovis aries]